MGRRPVTHGDIEATVKRLLKVPDQAFSEIVVAESRGRAGNDVVEALGYDWELCNRWVEALVAKSKEAKARLAELEVDSKRYNDTRFFLSKIDKRVRVARTKRAELERHALLRIIEEMDVVLCEAAGEDWVDRLSEPTYADFERFVP